MYTLSTKNLKLGLTNLKAMSKNLEQHSPQEFIEVIGSIETEIEKLEYEKGRLKLAVTNSVSNL